MDFVIIGNSWSAALDNPTSKNQIALELTRAGHRVLWLEGAGMRRPSLGSKSDRSRILRKLFLALRPAKRVHVSNHIPHPADIWVLSPLLIPLPSKAWTRWTNAWIFLMVARYWCRVFGFKNPVLINYVPVLGEIERLWARRKDSQVSVVYHCVDRWDRFERYDAALMTEMDRRCCRYADLVIASSGELYDLCRKKNPNTFLVGHGVNYSHFAKGLTMRNDRPKDLPMGAIVGFFGLLSEWVDQELIVKLALALRTLDPSAPPSIVLIGKADVAIDRFKSERNIHILGPRSFAALPEYVAWFDVAIIPFVVNDLTRAVNPIKLKEMLAAGCPVVSTALPEVARYAEGGTQTGGVTIGRDQEEFVRLVKERLELPLAPEARREVSLRMADETWEAKTREILSLIR